LKKLPRSGILRRVRGLPAPYPRRIGEEKLLVWGPDSAGHLLQVIFVLDEDGSAYILHARSLTEREKRCYRRQSR
jgi:hypothetical protein